MKTAATILGLVLVAMVGCNGSPDQGGFDVNPPGDMRGDVDAGAAGGAAGMAGGGGASGAAGSVGGHAGAGGSGAGGGVASAGGAPGAGGATTGSAGGAGGGGASYLPCSVYSWAPNGGTGCTKQTAPGVFLNGYKDGRACGICNSPTRPAGVPDCEKTGGLCVLSCDECVFQ